MKINSPKTAKNEIPAINENCPKYVTKKSFETLETIPLKYEPIAIHKNQQPIMIPFKRGGVLLLMAVYMAGVITSSPALKKT